MQTVLVVGSMLLLLEFGGFPVGDVFGSVSATPDCPVAWPKLPSEGVKLGGEAGNVAVKLGCIMVGAVFMVLPLV